MVNAHRKGREYENRLATFLRVNGYEAELLRLAGEVDRGDLWVPSQNQRIEVKAHSKVLNGINEAMKDVQKLNAAFPTDTNWGVIWRPGKPTGEWYAVRQVKDVWPDLDVP